MKIKYIIIGLLMATLGFYSCTDLETLPTDDDVSISNETLVTESDYLSFLAGIYANLSQPGQSGAFASNIAGIDGGSSTFSRTVWYLQEFTTDEAVWSYPNDAGVPDLLTNQWTDQNVFLVGNFARMAQTVAFCNEFIRRSAEVNFDSTPQMVAEAKFIRAMMYYYFLDFYRKAPYATENDPADIAFFPPQIEGQELFNAIEADVMSAMQALPEAGQNEYGRADKGAAWFLLTKLYLNSEVYTGTAKYTEALAQMDNIINSNAYSLNPQYRFNFTADNNLSPEIIFPLVSDGTYTQNYGATTVLVNGGVPSNFPDALNTYGQNGWGGALRLRQQAAEFLSSSAMGTRNLLWTTDRTINNSQIYNTDLGYCLTKFVNVTSTGQQGSNGANNDFVDTDLPLFRFADVHLMYAECLERGGTTSSGLNGSTLINLLRDRAGAPNITEADIDLDFLLAERTRELYWEGHRRQDLIRFGKYTGGAYNWEWKGNVASGSAISNHLKIFPIPARSLNTNSNLTQNSGY